MRATLRGERIEKLPQAQQGLHRTMRFLSPGEALTISFVGHPRRNEKTTCIRQPDAIKRITSSTDKVEDLNFTIVQRMPGVMDFDKTAFMGFV